MGQAKRSNCCNAWLYKDKEKDICSKCKEQLTEKTIHTITTRGTAKLELKNK